MGEEASAKHEGDLCRDYDESNVGGCRSQGRCQVRQETWPCIYDRQHLRQPDQLPSHRARVRPFTPQWNEISERTLGYCCGSGYWKLGASQQGQASTRSPWRKLGPACVFSVAQRNEDPGFADETAQ